VACAPTARRLDSAPHTPWEAELRLRFTAGAPRTQLLERLHRGPLRVQRTFHPEGAPCHVYLVHPPGGVAGGDRLTLHAELEPGAHALITTPAATKFYRALPGRRALLEQRLHVRDATLEWLPQEAIYFDAADVATRTRIELQGDARFIGWELSCYGRPACDEPFAHGRIRQSLEVWRDAQPLWLDALRTDGGHPMQRARWGLQGATALGTLAAWPCTPADLEALRHWLDESRPGEDAMPLSPQRALTATGRRSLTLVDGLLLARALGTGAADLRAALLPIWQWLRPRLLRCPAVEPRIWAT